MAPTLARRLLDELHSGPVGITEVGHPCALVRTLIDHRGRDFEQAESCYWQALALADELGMRPLLAYCHLSLGRLYRRTGDRPKAEEHLGIATMLFSEMDIRFWLEQAEAERKALG